MSEKTDKQKIGQLGENIASMFLKKHGYTTNTRNYRKPWGEIDLVVQKGQDLRFIEVKTVVRDSLEKVTRETGEGDDYEPEDNIHPWKLKRLSRAIQTYLLENKIDEDEVEWQLDAVCVYLNPKGETLKIDWLEDVY